ncbi:hypothetical protein L1887_15318 [Cichorium endivia]|nr:hypothetical protein L1887_15318 [Cichorium endivia]
MMAVSSSSKGDPMGMDNGKYVRYTPEQVEALERLYHDCPKPSSLLRQQLIRECPMSRKAKKRGIEAASCESKVIGDEQVVNGGER